MAGTTAATGGATKTSVALANLLSETTARDAVILRLLRHANSGMLSRFVAEDSRQLPQNRPEIGIGKTSSPVSH
jgi:hypothetical protein